MANNAPAAGFLREQPFVKGCWQSRMTNVTDSRESWHGPDTERGAAVLDAKGLRALAHPVRVQLVGLLRKYGPSGFVEEDAERGNARERWWRSVHRSTCFNDRDLAALPKAPNGSPSSRTSCPSCGHSPCLRAMPALTK